jgi:transcriptional regulator with XRE-family HTH domain
MDDQRIGRSLRVLRQRRGMRQSDVAAAAGVAQSLISEIEAGRIEPLQLGALRRVFAAVGAGFGGSVDWRGAALDRLLDARHAAVAASSGDLLLRFGWDVHPEVTYSIYGERGSIDVLAVRPAERAALVEEVKSELGTVEGTLRKLDEKTRLVAERIVDDRFGWRPGTVGRLLVLPDTDTARRAVREHALLLDAAFPDRGPSVRRWLRAPAGQLSGILFVPADANIARGDRRAGGAGVQRVRPPGTTARRRRPSP